MHPEHARKIKKNRLDMAARLLLICFTLLVASAVRAATHQPAPHPGGGTPLLQFHAGGHLVGFAPQAMTVSGTGHRLEVRFVDARPVAPRSVGSSSAKEHSHIACQSMGTVTYPDLWPGVSLVYSGARGLLESIYRICPEAATPAVGRRSVDRIRLRYNAPVSLDHKGNLVVACKGGRIHESAPIAWQEIGGRRIPVAVAFRILADNEVGFEVAPYNTRYGLTIDPVMNWNTFIGSAADIDYTRGIAVDNAGNVYISGYSNGTWGTPVNAHNGGIDAFVAKLDSSGTPIWHTYLGAGGDDWGYGITVDDAGNLYAVGYSRETWGNPVNPHAGGIDAYVTQLDATNGNRRWHTFLGSSTLDYAYSIVTDNAGSLWIAGRSDGGWGSPVTPHGGDMDLFLTQLNAATGNRIWHTFIGSTGTDYGYGLDRDDKGNLVVGGRSDTGWGTPLNSHIGNGEFDAFVAKLSQNGAMIWHTFMGSSEFDYSAAVSVDPQGDIYLAGYSSGSWGDPLMPHIGDKDVFVAKLDGQNGTRRWHTFMGSTAEDYSSDLALDAGGDIFVIGFSDTTWGTPSTPHAGSTDGFIAKLDHHSGKRLWNTFNGSTDSDLNYTAAVNGDDQLYIAGRSGDGWGTPSNPFSGGATDSYVAALAPTFKLTVHLTGIGSGTISGFPSGLTCADTCVEELDQGAVAALTTTPGADSTFSGWAGVGCAGVGDCTVSLSTDRIIRAHFNNPTLDSDGDGIADLSEQGPQGNDTVYDGNADGTPDWQQADVISSHSANGERYLTYSVPQNVRISAAEVIEKPLLTEPPEELSFQLGFFDFTVNNIPLGDAVVLTFRLPAGTAPQTYYKFGPTPDNPVDHWYEFLYDGTTGAQIRGDEITLHFKDGQRGDSDLDATNGIIVDPGGPGFSYSGDTPQSDSGGGCMIHTLRSCQ